jgi:hypothetical protein
MLSSSSKTINGTWHCLPTSNGYQLPAASMTNIAAYVIK